LKDKSPKIWRIKINYPRQVIILNNTFTCQ
jgi:hypothetical protein